MPRITNTTDSPYTFGYLTEEGPDGDLRYVTVGAKSDHNIVGRPQPTLDVTREVWDKIKHKVMGFAGTEFEGKPLRVAGA